MHPGLRFALEFNAHRPTTTVWHPCLAPKGSDRCWRCPACVPITAQAAYTFCLGSCLNRRILEVADPWHGRDPCSRRNNQWGMYFLTVNAAPDTDFHHFRDAVTELMQPDRGFDRLMGIHGRYFGWFDRTKAGGWHVHFMTVADKDMPLGGSSTSGGRSPGNWHGGGVIRRGSQHAAHLSLRPGGLNAMLLCPPFFVGRHSKMTQLPADNSGDVSDVDHILYLAGKATEATIPTTVPSRCKQWIEGDAFHTVRFGRFRDQVSSGEATAFPVGRAFSSKRFRLLDRWQGTR